MPYGGCSEGHTLRGCSDGCSEGDTKGNSESLQINAQLIYDKEVKCMKWNKILLTKCLLGNWLASSKTNKQTPKLDISIAPYTNVNLKYMKDLDIRPMSIMYNKENANTISHTTDL